MTSRYAGMTVNERLFDAGLLDAFDEAVAERNVAGIRGALVQVDVPTSDIEAIVSQIEKTPQRR